MKVPSTDGVEIAVHDLGGDGPRLLISHATGFHGWCYEPLAHALAGVVHSVAFDYRGHGDTPRPAASLDRPIDWQTYGDDAATMARWLVEQNGGEPIDAFGHSMGGACLLMAAHRAPSLFRHLVLFEPIVFPPQGIRPGPPANDSGENPMAVAARRRRSTFPSYEAAIENFSSKPPLRHFTPEAMRAYVLHGFAADEHGVHLKCRPETEAQTFEMGGHHDTWAHLPGIGTDVLVVAGRVEEFQPSNIARQVADRLPNARYLELPELDHFGPMVRPEVVAGVITEAIGAG